MTEYTKEQLREKCLKVLSQQSATISDLSEILETSERTVSHFIGQLKIRGQIRECGTRVGAKRRPETLFIVAEENAQN